MGNLQGILTQEERQDDDWNGNTVLGQWALQSKQTLRQQSWNQEYISTQLGSHFPNSNGVWALPVPIARDSQSMGDLWATQSMEICN